MKQEDIKAFEQNKTAFSNQSMSDLEKGEQQAAKLCQTLRAQGIEAYEFYDRHNSIVTVGSFDFDAQQMADGRMHVNPQVQQVIERFQGEALGNNSYKRIAVAGIVCDIQPKVIEVPRTRR
jgi:pantothenate kinase